MRSSPIANSETSETELPPVYTAAEFARQLRCTRQNVSKRLYRVSASDFKFPGGIETRAWAVTDLPNNVREEWEAVARQRGYRDLLAMMSHEMEFWQPALPLNQIDRANLDEAHKLRQVIRPLLESGTNDLSRGLIEYNAVFDRPITLRHFRRLLDRSAERAGYGGDLNRIELYLPERLKRVVKEQTPPPEEVSLPGFIHVFADIHAVIDRTNPANPEPENVKEIRILALKHYDRLISKGVSNSVAGDKIRQLLFEKAPFLVTASDDIRRRDALRKQFSRWLAKRAAHGDVTDLRKDNGRDLADFTKKLVELKWFIPDAKGFYLLSNRTKTSGSVPEAIRRTISQEKCPKEIREEILMRQRQGKPLVPESIARQIVCSAAVVQYHRNPTEAALRYANASGGSKFKRASGEYKPLRCGQRMIPDDGSINFVVCIPWEFPTSMTSKKFGVMLGRFQLLLFVDAVSYRISARSFVIRPKGSYRTEDVLHLYNIFAQQYGLPEEVFHEGGIWNSRRVKDCLDRLNIRR